MDPNCNLGWENDSIGIGGTVPYFQTSLCSNVKRFVSANIDECSCVNLHLSSVRYFVPFVVNFRLWQVVVPSRQHPVHPIEPIDGSYKILVAKLSNLMTWDASGPSTCSDKIWHCATLHFSRPGTKRGNTGKLQCQKKHLIEATNPNAFFKCCGERIYTYSWIKTNIGMAAHIFLTCNSCIRIHLAQPQHWAASAAKSWNTKHLTDDSSTVKKDR